MILVRTFTLILLIVMQGFVSAAHFHVEVSGHHHASSKSCHDDSPLSTEVISTSEHHSESENTDCCHMHCCTTYLPTIQIFKAFYGLEITQIILQTAVRLKNYHNSVYRPPIA